MYAGSMTLTPLIKGQLQSKGSTNFTFDSAHRLTGYGSNSY